MARIVGISAGTAGRMRISPIASYLQYIDRANQMPAAPGRSAPMLRVLGACSQRGLTPATAIAPHNLGRKKWDVEWILTESFVVEGEKYTGRSSCQTATRILTDC